MWELKLTSRIEVMKIRLLFFLLFACGVVHAESFIIKNGERRTDQLTLDSGEKGVIEVGGALGPTRGINIRLRGSGASITNCGSIEREGGDSIFISGSGHRFSNFGEMSLGANRFNAVALRNADEAFVHNAGSIKAKGNGCFCMDTLGLSNSRIINEGYISNEGPEVGGICLINSTNNQVNNNGLVTVAGEDSSGLLSVGGSDNCYTNAGSIFATESTGKGLLGISGSTNLTFVNSGDVMAGESGVSTDSSIVNFHLINSGLICSENAHALFLEGTNPTVTLLPGSNLQGFIQVPNAPLNVNVQAGLNLSLTLTPTSMGFGQLTSMDPSVLVGSTLHVVDRTGLALQADLLADISDPILNNIYRHRTAFPCACYNPCGCGFWIEAIGSYREREENHLARYNLRQGGFIVGYEVPGGLGLFAGASYGEATVGEKTQNVDVKTSFGGMSYEHVFCNHFFGAAFAAGYTHLDNERYVMNNLVVGGIERAHAQPSGFFFTPEITYAHSFCNWWCSPILSGTIRYAGLFLGDYSEQGSNSNLAVHDRDIQLLTIRGELSAPKCTCFLDIEPYIGVAGRFQVAGCAIDAELVGQALNFNSGISGNLAIFLVGFRSAKTLGCFDLFLDVEASWDHGRSYRIFGDAGIEFSF